MTPPVAGADLRAALVASCLRGALRVERQRRYRAVESQSQSLRAYALATGRLAGSLLRAGHFEESLMITLWYTTQRVRGCTHVDALGGMMGLRKSPNSRPNNHRSSGFRSLMGAPGQSDLIQPPAQFSTSLNYYIKMSGRGKGGKGLGESREELVWSEQRSLLCAAQARAARSATARSFATTSRASP